MSKNYITQTINNQHAITIVSKSTSYAHGLSSVERILGHFLGDPGPMDVTISRQKFDLLLKFTCNNDLGPKRIIILLVA